MAIREMTYSLDEANWLVEEIRKQKGWTYIKLAEEVGVDERFMRFFRTGERTSHPIYEKLTKLYMKPPIEMPPPIVPPKLKLEIHAYISENDTPEFFKNIGKYLRMITKGTDPRRLMQGKPTQLTLEDFMRFDEKQREVKEEFAGWLSDTAEKALQSFYGSTKPLKGKSKITTRFDKISGVAEEDEGIDVNTIEESIDVLEGVEEEYRPIVFRIAGEKAVTLEEFDDKIIESGKFFEERERYEERDPEESMTYTRDYLRDLGFTPEEIEEYRIVRGKEEKE